MTEILDPLRDALEGQIDFEGQRFADQLNTNILAVVGLISLMTGYFTQNLQHALWIGLIGTAVTFILIVPPWPFFNAKPAKWLPASNIAPSITVDVKE